MGGGVKDLIGSGERKPRRGKQPPRKSSFCGVGSALLWSGFGGGGGGGADRKKG